MALTLCELKDRLGLKSVRQVRRRVDLARPLLAPYLRHGKNNQLIFDENAVMILDRLCQLEKQGRTIEQAVEEIQLEMGKAAEGKPGRSEGEPGAIASAETLQVKIKLLEERIEDLRRREEDLRAERDRLLQIIENQGEQLRALMPGRGLGPGSSENGGRVSRWKALKWALLGRP